MSSSSYSTPSFPYFSCIFARDSVDGGIGYKNTLPWNLKDDMIHFKKITTFNTEDKENVVIMGRRTWEGMGEKPLSKRINIVVSKTLDKIEGVTVASSLDDALQKALIIGKGRYIFVIGGVDLYLEAFNHPQMETIYETKVSMYFDVEYDTFFDMGIPVNFERISSREVKGENFHLEFVQYNKTKESSERGYLSLVKEILETGEERGDRTGTGTISVFGKEMRFDLTKGFPLMTTKTVGLKTVFEELIWMIRGQTNNNTLKRKKVNIWTENSDSHHKKIVKREIEKNGVSTHQDGDLGALYGYQWRSFGGNYNPVVFPKNATENEKIAIEDKRHIGEGFDQIKYIIDEIRNNPESRRILFSGWNPQVLNDVCLPSCHFAGQFYIRNKKYLDCKLNMRSNDIFLGAPFNVSQYSLLVFMISAMTGYIPGELVYSIGDAHIYINHVEQMKQQLLRPMRDLPTLEVLRVPEKIEDFEFSDFKLNGYHPHPSIKGVMAV